MAQTASATSGIDATTNPSIEAGDPFSGDIDKMANTTANGADRGNPNDSAIDDTVRNNSASLSPPNSPRDRRMSREWDAAKVPPSQFQKRKGSIYSTPGSRDSHHENKDRDKAYHDKLKEKGWKLFGKK